MIGTVMAANVFFVIIPAHWELIRAKEAGREPDPLPALHAKQRSVQNNYLTLPVLLTMLAAHFPFAYGVDHAWLVLVGLMAIGAWVRLFYNLRHAGTTHWWMPVAAAVAFVALAVWVERADDPVATPDDPAVVQRGRSVFAAAGCGGCHTLADAERRTHGRPRPRRRGAVGRARRGSRPERPRRDARFRGAPHGRGDRRRGRLRLGGGVGLGSAAMLSITAGGFAFTARLEEEAAPATVAAFRRLLPLESRIIHVRWSGRRAGSPSATWTSASGRRTRPATRTPARSSCTRAACRRRRSCSLTERIGASKAGQLAEPLRDDRRGHREPPSAGREVPLGGRPGDRVCRAPVAARSSRRVAWRALHSPTTPPRSRSRARRTTSCPIAMSQGAIPFDEDDDVVVALARKLTGDDLVELADLEPVELAGGHRLDEVAGLEPGVLERVATDERRAGDHAGVELAGGRVVRADRAHRRSVAEPVAAQHGVARRGRRDDDVAAAGVGGGPGDLGAVLLRDTAALGRPARDDDPLERGHRRADRGELRLGLPPRPDQPEARGRSSEARGGDAARRSRPHAPGRAGRRRSAPRASRRRDRRDRRRTRACPRRRCALEPGDLSPRSVAAITAKVPPSTENRRLGISSTCPAAIRRNEPSITARPRPA